jgi:hypothetical protein
VNGPGHYAMAVRLLNSVELDDSGIVYDEASSGTVATIAKAQVHATLALAAATAEPMPEADDYEAARDAWRAVGAW